MRTTDTQGGGDMCRPGGVSDLPRLSAAEDVELRQLAWFSKAGQLSETSQARLLELRARDRRDTIRDPRPDPSGGRIEGAPSFGSDGAGRASTCPNCGSGTLRSAGSSRSCSYCGFSQRYTPDLPALQETAVDSSLRPPEPRALGSIDKDSFRDLLVTAARGGSAGSSQDQ